MDATIFAFFNNDTYPIDQTNCGVDDNPFKLSTESPVTVTTKTADKGHEDNYWIPGELVLFFAVTLTIAFLAGRHSAKKTGYVHLK